MGGIDMCGSFMGGSGGGFSDLFSNVLNIGTMGLIGESTTDKELAKSIKAQNKAQAAALEEQERLTADAAASAAAATAAQEEIDTARKARIAESYLTSGKAAGEENITTRKSYLGAAQ